jgi:hypothetical protein
LGRPINARPIASICCWPPDSVPAGSARFSFRMGNMRKDLFQVALDLVLGLGVGAQAQVVFNRQRAKHLAAFRALANTAAHAHVGTQLADVLAVKRTLPALIGCTPDKVRRKVVLPAPLAPTSATVSPRRTSRLMPLSALMRP